MAPSASTGGSWSGSTRDAARLARQADRDGVPGPDGDAQPGAHDRDADEARRAGAWPLSRDEARGRATEARWRGRHPRRGRRLDAFPHQFSGGMRQRVAIAIALLHGPELIIADEPTTALDVSIQAQILAEMRKLARDLGTALIWISHDLATVSSLADPHDGDVCGPHRRGGPDRRGAACAAPSLHARPARSRCRRGRAGARTGPDPRHHAVAAAPARGCPFAPRCAGRPSVPRDAPARASRPARARAATIRCSRRHDRGDDASAPRARATSRGASSRA